MSTRSRIGIAIGKNPVCADTVYCHCGGYPQGVGKCLLQFWNDTDKVAEMIANGDMSYIGDTVEECFFYTRDRGENCPSRKLQINKVWENSYEEYNYIFYNGVWYYREVRDAKWKLLVGSDCMWPDEKI